jgi:uncharacterized protein YukE
VSMSGMEIEGVRRLAHQMQGEASDLRRQLARITARVNAVTWSGPDRERFVNEWITTRARWMQTAITDLDEASRLALRFAAQQQTVSGGW